MRWVVSEDRRNREEGVQISFLLFRGRLFSRREILMNLAKQLKDRGTSWIYPVNSPSKGGWVIDLDELRAQHSRFHYMEWLKGGVLIEPEVEDEDRSGRTMVSFYVTQNELRRVSLPAEIPTAITESYARFRNDYPDPRKVAFVMMEFQETKAHREIMAGIERALSSAGITGVRADTKKYHDTLYYNILTYLHGSGFGIAVFDRIVANQFNPNVALEVGYLLAMPKPLCLLKDKTLEALNTDLELAPIGYGLRGGRPSQR